MSEWAEVADLLDRETLDERIRPWPLIVAGLILGAIVGALTTRNTTA